MAFTRVNKCHYKEPQRLVSRLRSQNTDPTALSYNIHPPACNNADPFCVQKAESRALENDQGNRPKPGELLIRGQSSTLFTCDMLQQHELVQPTNFGVEDCKRQSNEIIKYSDPAPDAHVVWFENFGALSKRGKTERVLSEVSPSLSEASDYGNFTTCSLDIKEERVLKRRRNNFLRKALMLRTVTTLTC